MDERLRRGVDVGRVGAKNRKAAVGKRGARSVTVPQFWRGDMSGHRPSWMAGRHEW